MKNVFDKMYLLLVCDGTGKKKNNGIEEQWFYSKENALKEYDVIVRDCTEYLINECCEISMQYNFTKGSVIDKVLIGNNGGCPKKLWIRVIEIEGKPCDESDNSVQEIS